MRGDDFRQRLDYFRTLLQEIERESKANAGMIRRAGHLAGFIFPRPVHDPHNRKPIVSKVCDIFSNLADLSDQGQLTMTPSMQNDGELIRKWTHLLEETGARGGVEVDLIEAARRPLFAYFADGIPLGVQLISRH